MSLKNVQAFQDYLHENFDEATCSILRNRLDAHNNRDNRSEYLAEVQDSISDTIEGLEQEVSNLLDPN